MGHHTLADVNQLSLIEFVALFGAVFEATPEIAAKAWQARPFDSLQTLHQTMCRIVERRDRASNLQLLQAHPDLGSRIKMAMASVQEQARAGLTILAESEFVRFQQLNQAYRERFGFPFIIAVRDHTKESVLAQFEVRLLNSVEQEYTAALSEVMKIALYRLVDIVSEAA